MEKLIKKIKRDHPGLVFNNSGRSHCWSPDKGQIVYPGEEHDHSIEGLLHELGHARLAHQGYISDLELLQKEVEAWQEAVCLAGLYGVDIDEEHMQDCLDTYRDWVHKRSICPSCQSTGLQQNESTYVCLNCGHDWHVTSSRFCRPYRRSASKQKDQ
jgi:hypothetical protein